MVRAPEGQQASLQGLSSHKRVFPDPAGLPTNILHALAGNCVVQATGWNYLLKLGRRPPGADF